MPGIPLVARETSYSRSTDQMCRQDSRLHLSAEEEIVAEESFSVYCKPVELYNILQRRAERNPAFLQRCLCYKIEANKKRRIQMTISLSGALSEAEAQCLFPLHVLLARSVTNVRVPEHSAEYRFSRACILNKYAGSGRNIPTQASFSIPEISKLALEARSGSVSILLVSGAGTQNSYGIDLTKSQFSATLSSSNGDGCCLFGKITLESLYTSWVKSPSLILGHRAEIKPTIAMHPCLYKLRGSNEDKRISFQAPYNSNVKAAQEVQVIISAEEFGAKENSPYNLYKCSSDIPSSSLTHIVRLRAGNVVFNYRYYNNQLQQTEVTEDFSCPFCLVKCASFKGLKYHLLSSHDLFNFEFWVTEEYQAVNVSVKTDIVRSEVVADGVDPKQQTFFFCPKPRKRKRTKSLIRNAKNVHPFGIESDMVTEACELVPKADDAQSSKGERARIAGASSSLPQSSADPDCAQSVPGSSLAHSTVLQFAKTRKLSVERSDPRNRALLQKRQFFHSHRAQPMAVEQVTSERDSEDEVDDDVADFEDRRMLDDFVDVTKDEKQMMHMWNSFVRKQRVLADSHIPWACEAFSRLHGQDLIQTPALRWCWRLFMIKLWNHGLLDARTMNNCNVYLEQESQNPTAMKT